MALLPRILRPNPAERQAQAHRDMIRREAKIGGKLFGPIPAGHQREFFCLDAHTWVWHESWHDAQGKQQSVTTRYEVRPNGVLKVQNDKAYQSLSYDEAVNLYRAVELYERRVLPLYAHAA